MKLDWINKHFWVKIDGLIKAAFSEIRLNDQIIFWAEFNWMVKPWLLRKKTEWSKQFRVEFILNYNIFDWWNSIEWSKKVLSEIRLHERSSEISEIFVSGNRFKYKSIFWVKFDLMINELWLTDWMIKLGFNWNSIEWSK